MTSLEKALNTIVEKNKQLMEESYELGRQDERERITKLLNVQEDEDGNFYIDLTDALKEALGIK